ncbi:MAG: DUF1275 domain-containing protein [Clostridiales bacterium]|nr:DUF1275 domain-containing protein [Clostridiales bacterium]
MDREEKREMQLHFAVSAVGGFFGGYAIFNHCDILGNSQTANIIHLFGKIFTGDLSGIAFMVAALVTYISGNVFCVAAKKFIKIDLRVISFLFDAAAITAIGVLPRVSNDYLALLPILFVAPIQWNAFQKAGEYTSSTIFSTNNLRQASMASAGYFIDKDKKQLKKAKFFWTTLLSFNTGAGAACVLSGFFGVDSVWFGFVPLAVSVLAYFRLLGMRYFEVRRRALKLKIMHVW